MFFFDYKKGKYQKCRFLRYELFCKCRYTIIEILDCTREDYGCNGGIPYTGMKKVIQLGNKKKNCLLCKNQIKERELV